MRNIGHTPVVWSGPGGVGMAGCGARRLPASDTGDKSRRSWKTDSRAPSLEIECTVLRTRKNSRGLWSCFLGRLIPSAVVLLFNILSS